MDRVSRTTAVATVIAVVFQCFLPSWAASGATIEGTVEVPSDPSRVSEVASIEIRPVSGGSAATVAVDPSTGRFLGPQLTQGEYELVAIGTDGRPLFAEPKRLLLRAGSNTVALSLQPPDSGEQDSEKKTGKKRRLKDWHLTLIYFGAIGAIILALDDDDDEDLASPSGP